jgi:nicotinamide riboside kinase
MDTPPIFLFGGGGVGKTTLLNFYVERYNGNVHVITEVARPLLKERNIDQADLQDDDVFWDLQIQIARRQLQEEQRHELAVSADNLKARRGYISDRCVLDTLVYSSLRFPERFPLLQHASTEKERAELLAPLTGDMQTAEEVIRRYRKSTMALICPFDSNDAVDDGVRLVMTRKELEEYTERCRLVLTALDIQSVEIAVQGPSERLQLLEEAIASRS